MKVAGERSMTTLVPDAAICSMSSSHPDDVPPLTRDARARVGRFH
jgi:hypothetical protein